MSSVPNTVPASSAECRSRNWSDPHHVTPIDKRDPRLPRDLYNPDMMKEFRHALPVQTHACPGTCEKNFRACPGTLPSDSDAKMTDADADVPLPVKKCNKGAIYEIPIALLELPSHDVLKEYRNENDCPVLQLSRHAHSNVSVNQSPRVDLLNNHHGFPSSYFSRLTDMRAKYDVKPHQRAIIRNRDLQIYWKPPPDAERKTTFYCQAQTAHDHQTFSNTGKYPDCESSEN